MSLIDKQTEFSDAQAVTATAISTNVYDNFAGNAANQNTLRDVSGGGAYLVIGCVETVTAVGAATVTITLESDSDAALVTSPTVHYTSPAIPKATLVAGYRVAVIPLPVGEYERFMGVRYTVATGPLTAGKFDAYITRDPNLYRAYANAI
jgi:hypothetical protein